jgi:trigger factor
MAALGARATFPVPRALVQEEQQRLQQMAQAEIDTRGGGQQPALEVFAAAAEQRVRLSLLLGELVRNEALQPRPEQVRAAVETMARGYERPAEVVQWILGDRNRVADIENTVAEDNVIAWALSRGRVTDLAVAFDDLMGGARA